MEETIELREIIEILLKGKWIIAIFTIVAMLFAGVMSWFVLEETYESKAVVQLSSDVQDTDINIMSNYVAAEFTPTTFMQLIQNEVFIKQAFEKEGYTDFHKANLSTSNQANTDLVELTYKNASPEEAQKHLQFLIEQTKSSMNASIKETLNELAQMYFNESTTLSVEIEQLMNQYNNIITSNKLPEVLILQTIVSSEVILNLTTEQTNSLANINGSLQNKLLQLKAQIDVKSEEYQTVLAKYQSVKTGLNSFKPDSFIRVMSEPTLAGGPASPNKPLNLVIGLVLGLMVGVGYVFSREYWRNSAVAK